MLIIGAVFLVPLTRSFNKHPVEFYGIAEAETRSVNLEYPVVIEKMEVVLGEKVKAGQLLAKLHRTSLPIKINDINYELKELSRKKVLSDVQLDADMKKLEGQRELLQTEYAAKIAEIETELAAQEKILEGLTTIKPGEIKNPLREKISALKEELSKKLEPIEAALLNLENEKRESRNLVDVRVNKLRGELDLIREQEDALLLSAPISGIIGQLNYQSGENVEDYQTILKIYGERPNIITTYIPDGQLAQINLNDTLDITSINAPDYKLAGVVIGLGTRITQLPDRLKKIPEIKAWGREVQVQISSDNQFMQGEKVLVSLQKLPPPPPIFGKRKNLENPQTGDRG